jgi:heat shock protein HtpX
MNAVKSGLLMFAIFALFMLIGSAFGTNGMIIAFLVALVMNGITYWFSDKIVLAMYRAQEVPEDKAPRLHEIVAELSQAAGIPKPKVYIIQSASPNAFATGRNPQHAAVAVTTGILKILDDGELKGVLAHELAHVTNRDILTASIVATVAAAITLLASIIKWGVIFGGIGGRSRDDRGSNPIALLAMAILAPFAAMVIQLWLSRTREYAADERGARLAHDPLLLASALGKLDRASRQLPLEANQATAHMFIVKPFSGRGMMSIFSTHPPIEERIARLRKMAERR